MSYVEGALFSIVDGLKSETANDAFICSSASAEPHLMAAGGYLVQRRRGPCIEDVFHPRLFNSLITRCQNFGAIRELNPATMIQRVTFHAKHPSTHIASVVKGLI